MLRGSTGKKIYSHLEIDSKWDFLVYVINVIIKNYRIILILLGFVALVSLLLAGWDIEIAKEGGFRCSKTPMEISQDTQ